MRLAGLLLFIVAVLFAGAAHAVTIDGHIEPGEWKGALHITDFRDTQPLTGKPGSLPTEAWVLATPKGLAVAFRCIQPPGVPRSTQHVQRDFDDQVDRVNLIVDFDGDGRVGYNFTVSSTGGVYDAVVTNESHFDKDWDGNWKSASSEDAQGWTVEMLIPWYIAPMRRGHDGKRIIGLYLDRVVAATGERMAWPVASYQRARFLSDFRKIQVPDYSQSLLAITPYVSAVYDNVHGTSQFKRGADIFWKPNGQFQLTATLNPDFGEVESDDLVVNFGATETYYSDKRPFFTENQGIFDFSLLDDNSQLVYTRRVGGPADDGQGVSNIDGAVKLNGSVGNTSYGLLAADEAGTDGRRFSAVRLVHAFGSQNLGLMLTDVDHPWLDREARVIGIDDHWHPTPGLTVAANVVGSDIAQSGVSTHGSGATLLIDADHGHGWREEWAAMHFNPELQVNDFGYLERNDFDYAHWEVRKRITDLSSDSIYTSHDWRVRVDGMNDTEGLDLRRQLRIERDSSLRNGASEDVQLNINSAAWDDLLTRGHGALYLPATFDLSYQHDSPRHGLLSYNLTADVLSGGLGGNRSIGYEVKFIPTYYLTDTFNLYAGPYYEHQPDWLVWQHDNLIGRFDEHTVELLAGFDWSIGNRQELRMKLEGLGLDARLRGAYRVNGNGRAMVSTDPVGDLGVRNMGLQLRYRYKLAPLSYLYVVYARGGYVMDDYVQDRGVGRLFQQSFSLRDDEQLLVKLDYRFDI
ncbi:DUF5916 domain-containing protein [Dyella sp. A6]|uniref:DUF5916 domain-containing protein n=1 Tax=Dyella aluminiiresistens TaxID=3069105 RepID=UPI002E772731|nr:DUF5916 domain-containing protein [Dyella sp. A6]